MKFKYNKQDGIKDCGASVLYNIIRYYGGNINFEKLRNMTNTDSNGTSVYDIVTVANRLGLKSVSYRCEINDLVNLKFPIVCHILVEEKYSHFVIAKAIEDDEILLFDPVRGNIKYSLDLFIKEWSGVIITFEKTDNLVNEKDDYKEYLFTQIKDNKNKIIFITVLSIICTIISSFNSFYIGKIIDNKTNNYTLLFLFLSFTFFSILLTYIKNNIIIEFNASFDSKLTKDIYNHILFLPSKYHHSRPAGDIISRTYDLYYIKDLINELSNSIIVDILLTLIIGIFLFVINKIIFLISLFIIIIYICIYLLYRNKINELILINQENQSKVSSCLLENILGIDTIKGFNLENSYLHKQNKTYASYLTVNKKLNKIYNNFQIIEDSVQGFGIIFVIFIGSLLINNEFTLGNIVTCNSLLINIFSCIKRLISSDNLVINSKNAYKRINELFSIEEEKEICSKKTFKNSVKFKNLSFSYKNTKLIENFNLLINKNDYILITGKSGIGKSTIFKLLTRQIDCDSKMILLDNEAIDKYESNYIKSKICFISQNEFIFTDTIKNNINIFNKAVTKEEFDKILKISMVDKILENKKIDINYLLEENGHNLSGGERQKILIARALLSNRNFIIFDETMNEIDVESERKILKNIKTEYNKTLILISHRLNNKDLFNKCVQL